MYICMCVHTYVYKLVHGGITEKDISVNFLMLSNQRKFCKQLM